MFNDWYLDESTKNCLIEFVTEELVRLIDLNKDDWGYSLESFITGINNAHPNQIKKFKDDKVSLLESYLKLKAIAHE